MENFSLNRPTTPIQSESFDVRRKKLMFGQIVFFFIFFSSYKKLRRKKSKTKSFFTKKIGLKIILAFFIVFLYWYNYPHTPRGSVSPVCGIFCEPFIIE